LVPYDHQLMVQLNWRLLCKNQ